MKIAVIFRTLKDNGDAIALFPFEASDNSGWCCQSYQHVGQHGAASPVITQSKYSRPCTKAEASELAKELRRIGYKLDIRKRIPRNAFDVRRRQVKRTT